MADEFPVDDDLESRLDMVELEERCVRAGLRVEEVCRRAGYGFDATTFVVAELVQRADARGVDPMLVVGWFQARGFVSGAVETLAG